MVSPQGAALIAGCGNPSKKETTDNTRQKPNVIYLIADDLGIGDLSCYGATKISTLISTVLPDKVYSLPMPMLLPLPVLLPASVC